LAEQRFCKPQVPGSIPGVGSVFPEHLPPKLMRSLPLAAVLAAVAQAPPKRRSNVVAASRCIVGVTWL
jgi:hypothetical protein